MLISVFTAEVIAASTFVIFRSVGLGLLFLAAGIASVFEWTNARRKAFEAFAVDQLKEARAALDQGRLADAWDRAGDAAEAAVTRHTRNAALAARAWAALGQGKPALAQEILGEIWPGDSIDAYTVAAIKDANGRSDEAISVLERASRSSTLNREAARFLVELYANAGKFQRVVTASLDLVGVFGTDDIRLIVRGLEKAGEFRHGATLAVALGVMFDNVGQT
jgi:tetratricopeptide (TPR) repeat protein